jgi:hypothetical protein
VQAFVLSTLALCLFVGVGIGAIVMIRTWMRGADELDGSGRGDWESALAGYKNLRDKGVLSEEEYRKIRTAVEPPKQIAPGTVQPPLPSSAAGHFPKLPPNAG